MEYQGYKIVSDGRFSMMLIKAIGKGSVPLELRGQYTNTEFAKQAIDAQLAIKGDKNVKAKQSD